MPQGTLGHGSARPGLGRLEDRDVLGFAEEAGFEVLVTSDQSIRYQQNLKDRTIALVVLTQGRWKPVRRMLAHIATAVDEATSGSYTEVVIPFE